MSAGRPAVLASMSAAMDGGFTAIADVSQAMEAAGAADDYRLIGGVTVMLHVQRLGLDLPLRATGDADFGVPPSVLRRPGLAEALRRPGITVDADLRLTDGIVHRTRVVLPDAVATLALKARARTVRNETRDAEDLWRCLEVAAAEGVTPEHFDGDRSLEELRGLLARELGSRGWSLSVLTEGLQDDAAARLRTRLRPGGGVWRLCVH